MGALPRNWLNIRTRERHQLASEHLICKVIGVICDFTIWNERIYDPAFFFAKLCLGTSRKSTIFAESIMTNRKSTYKTEYLEVCCSCFCRS